LGVMHNLIATPHQAFTLPLTEYNDTSYE